MRAYCISQYFCQYKTDTGYCNYSGGGCAQGLVRSVKLNSDAPFTVVRQVELTEECIQKIAEEVAKKLSKVTG